jgi:hypothetical protein
MVRTLNKQGSELGDASFALSQLFFGLACVLAGLQVRVLPVHYDN